MNVNILYLIIPCLSLALIVVILEMCTPLFSKSRKRKIIKSKNKWIQLFSSKNTNELQRKSVKYLAISHYLTAFSELMNEDYFANCKTILFSYSKNISQEIVKQKDNMLCGFFCHILSSFELIDLSSNAKDEYCKLMLELAKRKSVYCHENLLKVLYAIGEPQYIVEIFKFFTAKNILHNEKLLTDGLMTFKGDKVSLGKLLINDRQLLHIHYQTAAINFLSFSNIHNFDDELRNQLTSVLDLDYRCAILRLISKDKSPINREILLATLVDYSFSINWQPAAVAANGLSIFIDDEPIMKQLVKSCCSQNWSVRINSANTLVKIDTKRKHIDEVLKSNDKYAVDAINYALASKGAI